MKLPQKLTSKDRDDLVNKLLDIYQADPARLRKAFPEVAETLEAYFHRELLHAGSESPFGLTDGERAFRNEALESILKKSKALTKEGAIRGLEHAAALLIDNFSPHYPPRLELLRLVRKASGIQPRKEGKPITRTIGEGEPSRTVTVVKGVELHLTWDLKLLSITMDPKQWRLRGQALSFVGIGVDVATDVAERHDDYLVEAIQNG